MLTSFAGSIGIIGIALVLSISQGFNTYINTIQEETPVLLSPDDSENQHRPECPDGNLYGLCHSDSTHSNDAVYKKSAIYDMMDALNNMETSETT